LGNSTNYISSSDTGLYISSSEIDLSGNNINISGNLTATAGGVSESIATLDLASGSFSVLIADNSSSAAAS